MCIAAQLDFSLVASQTAFNRPCDFEQQAASPTPPLAVCSNLPPIQVALHAGQVVRDENLVRQSSREGCHVLPDRPPGRRPRSAIRLTGQRYRLQLDRLPASRCRGQGGGRESRCLSRIGVGECRGRPSGGGLPMPDSCIA
jgi:hypothetical protein